LRGLIGIRKLVAEQHQHGRRRENLRQGRCGGDDAGGKPRVIAEAQHRRQHDQSHGGGSGADHSFRGCQQHADHDHGNPEPSS